MLFMNLLLGQFCESLTFASAALVISARVRASLVTEEAFLTTPATPLQLAIITD